MMWLMWQSKTGHKGAKTGHGGIIYIQKEYQPIDNIARRTGADFRHFSSAAGDKILCLPSVLEKADK